TLPARARRSGRHRCRGGGLSDHDRGRLRRREWYRLRRRRERRGWPGFGGGGGRGGGGGGGGAPRGERRGPRPGDPPRAGGGRSRGRTRGRAGGGNDSRDDDRQAVLVLADRIPDLTGELDDETGDPSTVLAAANLFHRRLGDGQRRLAPRVHGVFEIHHQTA